MGETLLPKRIALPVFASDPLSSVAYSPDEIFLTLALAGVTAYTFSWKIAIVVGFVMLAVVLSYRQNVQAYQSGGGDFEVASTNLGAKPALTVASALLVDYVLTVAVSISSAAQYLATTVDFARGHEVLIAGAAVLFLAAMNLRGVRESGTAFAIPTYIFIFSMLGMVCWGLGQHFLGGGLGRAESADLQVIAEPEFADGFAGVAAAFLLLRAFASGCATLTGVEAIANGVPAFRKPKGKNAATTLALLGAIAITLAMSIVALANIIHAQVVEDPEHQLRGPNGEVLVDYHQAPLVGQIAHVVFDNFPPGFFLITLSTGMILLLAANTAFNGFPVLASILAKDGYAPRAFAARGDRLAYSNGIVILAGFSILLIVAFDAEVTRLIQLYIVGVFVAFTIGQAGMVRHWTRLLKSERDPVVRAKMQTSRTINAFGLSVTGIVLVVVLITKFTHGAWISIVAMAIAFLLMTGIRRHYDNVAIELAADERDRVLPTRVHAMVLVSKLHKPTLRALAFAQASRPNALEAVTVSTTDSDTAELLKQWDERNLPMPLKVLHSPYRELIRPVVEYASAIRDANPRGVVAVYIPEYVVGRWWEQFLHNQTALRLKGRLLFTPGVMVISVPYQLASGKERAEEMREEYWLAPGLRRGSDGRR
ncbi:APC family permease [Nocardioides sp. NPDC006273]|uniref:APC family permease n=1 Tax=Nocardioides sp. NPDC006273 TaxID=3155598 RepID=UPI0033BF8EBA